MTELTEQERDTIRGSAMGAMALVSNADKGFFAMFKESKAGSQALAKAPEEIRSLFTGFSMPPTGGSPADVQAKVLGQLTEAVNTLKIKSPELVEGYRSVIVAACDAVAEAAKGVSDGEKAMIVKVKAAIGG